MATEIVEATISLSDDGKTVTVTPTTTANNSKYEITLSGLYDADGNELDAVTVTWRTPYSPLYCTVDSLKLVVDTFGIPDEAMISYIRQASKEADFISGGTADSTDFAVEQFTRTKATYDCLTKAYMDRAYSGGGSSYKLDMAEYTDSLNSTAFKDMLNRLANELQKWQDAIRGYYNEGRVAPKATRVGLKSSQNSEVSWTTLDTIIQDVTRSSPQWS